MKIQALVATAAIAGTLGLGMTAPAKADGAASTRNLILGAAAIVAGVAIESNVNHKQQLANTVRGYTQNGSTVYRDGRVIGPNGQSWYPANQGQQISCDGQNCTIYANGTAYNGGYNNGYNNGYGQSYNNGWNGYGNAYVYGRGRPNN